MIVTKENSIPKKGKAYNIGESVFYYQFNDISFYIEDKFQENFFLCILRNLFPDIRIEKIFPLNGKKNVIEQSQQNLPDKKKVYIVDKDFDDLLDKIVDSPNLFYLDKYSIENYLFEEESIIQYIIGEKPQISRLDIADSFNLSYCLELMTNNIIRVVKLHVVTQANDLELVNVDLGHERFVKLQNGTFVPDESQINDYEARIAGKLSQKDGRYSISGRINKIFNNSFFNNLEIRLKHIPGKYIVKMLKNYIEKTFQLPQRNATSFCYRIADKCNFISLEFLKIKIANYIN